MSGGAITFKNLKTSEMIEMAEGLTDPRHYELATQLYKLALDRAAPEHRNALRTRIGLTSNPLGQTPVMRRVLREMERETGHVYVGEGLMTWGKTLGFYEDERFRTLAEKHAHLLPLPNWHWNLATVLWAVQRAKQLDGDLMELGVFKGHTTLFCAEYVDFAGWPKRWCLYDTFDGIPDDQVDAGWEGVNAGLYRGTFSHEEVRDRFAHIPNIEVVQGRVPEILSEQCPEKIAFLHLDLNSAAAEIAALYAVYDRLVSGACIVLDDYGWVKAKAQRVAEDAWFAELGLQVLPLATGQGLFVKP